MERGQAQRGLVCWLDRHRVCGDTAETDAVPTAAAICQVVRLPVGIGELGRENDGRTVAVVLTSKQNR